MTDEDEARANIRAVLNKIHEARGVCLGSQARIPTTLVVPPSESKPVGTRIIALDADALEQWLAASAQIIEALCEGLEEKSKAASE